MKRRHHAQPLAEVGIHRTLECLWLSLLHHIAGFSVWTDSSLDEQLAVVCELAGNLLPVGVKHPDRRFAVRTECTTDFFGTESHHLVTLHARGVLHPQNHLGRSRKGSSQGQQKQPDQTIRTACHPTSADICNTRKQPAEWPPRRSWPVIQHLQSARGWPCHRWVAHIPPCRQPVWQSPTDRSMHVRWSS